MHLEMDQQGLNLFFGAIGPLAANILGMTIAGGIAGRPADGRDPCVVS
jgi:hypothetical protein